MVHDPDTDARPRGIRRGIAGRKGDIRVHEDAKVCVPADLSGLAKCRCSKKTFEASHDHTGINSMMGAMVNVTSADKKQDKIVSFLGFRKPARAASDLPAHLSSTTVIVATSNNALFKHVRDAEMEQDLVVTALAER
jgi:hypothetical protein